MRCIFCKSNTSSSKSVEHIIPESLGNHKYTLPKGIVCDKCNNYFSRKIEGQLLEQPYFKNLRFRQRIESKRGRYPPTKGVLLNHLNEADSEVEIQFNDDERAINVYVKNKEAFENISKLNHGSLLLPMFDLPEKNNQIVSRFLGKVGLEELARRFFSISEEALNEGFIDETQLDLLKKFVRYGTPDMIWPYFLRRIHDEDDPLFVEGVNYQKVHEETLLFTDAGELYVVINIMGVEYALNMVGPELEGYEIWLKEHNNESPLNDKYYPNIHREILEDLKKRSQR